MGVSAQHYYETSQNGKGIVKMLAQRGDVEIVRDIIDWLVDQRHIGIRTQERQKPGRSVEAAEEIAKDAVSGMRSAANSINDRNVVYVAEKVIDEVFMSHYGQGPAAYAKIMAWFADQIRANMKEAPGDR